MCCFTRQGRSTQNERDSQIDEEKEEQEQEQGQYRVPKARRVTSIFIGKIQSIKFGERREEREGYILSKY